MKDDLMIMILIPQKHESKSLVSKFQIIVCSKF